MSAYSTPSTALIAAEREDHGAPPPDGRAEQVEHDAHEAVHRDLGHHAAHQRRYMARRGRVGQRQPHVQGHQAGLGSGSDQGQHQDGGGQAGRMGRCRADGIEAVTAGRAGQQAEGQQQRQGAEAGHQQVDVPRPGVVALLVVRHHQRPRGERHELPGEQEREGVVGQDDQIHAGQEHRKERQDAAGRRSRADHSRGHTGWPSSRQDSRRRETARSGNPGGNARRATATRSAVGQWQPHWAWVTSTAPAAASATVLTTNPAA